MTRDFPDELLSAYLDHELSPAERDQVECHLATNESARQLLAELHSLRGEVASLPPVAVGDDFTERVLKAALAAGQAQGLPAELPSPASSGSTAAGLTPTLGTATLLSKAE